MIGNYVKGVPLECMIQHVLQRSHQVHQLLRWVAEDHLVLGLGSTAAT